MNELGSFDFETASEAGHAWNEVTQKWEHLPGVSKSKRKGLGVVGTFAYAQHPTTRVTTFSYRLPGETTKHRWRPGQPPPILLFEALKRGAIFKAHNAIFELAIWGYVCVRKYGWPSLLPFRYQLRCTMATARSKSYPGALANLSEVLQLPTPKDADGVRLLDKFSVPRNPTKGDPRKWVLPPHERGPAPPDTPAKFLKVLAEDDADFGKLEGYCDTDLDAEEGAYQRIGPMPDHELNFWFVDQEINWRGIAIDRAGVRDCIAVLEQALDRYGQEFRTLTGFDVTQLQAAKGWLAAQGVHMASMDEEAIEAQLAQMAPHSPGAYYPLRRALEIRQLTGSASVKKLYAMEHQADEEDRLKNLIVHHGARTGRPTGEGPQPLNLPKAGPDLQWCPSSLCHRPFGTMHAACPWCGTPEGGKEWRSEWSGRPKRLPESAIEAVEQVLTVMSWRDLSLVEFYFGDALLCISGCVRGLFVAGPGRELIASDYSAIEAVVIAALAGETWRLEAFEQRKDIYLAGASTITGTPYEEYIAYKDLHGVQHPDRQKKGKISELALGFGGWVGSLRAFGFDGTDEEAKNLILAWRKASPAIVELWGGQFRGAPWDPTSRSELYGFEGTAIAAIQNPGVTFDCRGIKFTVRDTPAGTPALYVRLLSGRELTYHKPSLVASTRKGARAGELQILYWTWNSNPKYGAMGWVPMQTYGGRLTENIVQATAHDVLRHAILALRAAGYPTVLHVYDEIVVEVPEGAGSVEEVERIMSTMPAWAAGWPIRASGGWRGRRYRKG